MRPVVVVVRSIGFQDSQQMAFIEDNTVVDTLAPGTTDKSLGIRILPRGFRRGDDFFDSHGFDASFEELAEDAIAIVQEVVGRGVIRKRIHNLLRSPPKVTVLETL